MDDAIGGMKQESRVIYLLFAGFIRGEDEDVVDEVVADEDVADEQFKVCLS